MNAVNVDVRMLRRGSRWCAVAHITAPCLAAPVDLYSCCDIRQALPGLSAADLRSGNAMTLASSQARRQARREILAYTYNFFREYEPELQQYAERVQAILEACDKACDLVARARGGDERARSAIASTFGKAKNGDTDAEKSARLILESADLVDDGRTSFRVSGVEAPRRARRPMLSLPPRQMTGAEQLVLDYPGSPFPNLRGKIASDAFVLADAPYLPYPDDRQGSNFLQNFQPEVAVY